MNKYKKQLINTVRPVLKLLGYDIQKEFSTTISTPSHNFIRTEQRSSSTVIKPQPQIRMISLKKKVKNMRTRTGIERYQLIQI